MRRGEKVGRGPIHLRAASVRVPLSAVILGWLGRFLGRALMRVLSQPVLWAALTVYGIGYWLAVTMGPWPFVTAALAVTFTLVGWRQAHRTWFQRWFSWPVRSTWRRTLVYRRDWQPAMVTTGLAVRVNGREYLPRLVKVASTDSVDRVTVRMLPGQVAEDYADVVERLAQTFDAADCRVRTTRAPRPAHPVVPGARPAHRTRRTLGWRGRVGRGGAAGRTSRGRPDLPALPARLASAAGRRDRRRQVRGDLGDHPRAGPRHPRRAGAAVGVRPKGGMELAGGQPLFARFCHGAADDDHEAPRTSPPSPLLEDAVTVMRDRQDRLRGVTRLHNPDPEPLIVVVVDELAALTA